MKKKRSTIKILCIMVLLTISFMFDLGNISKVEAVKYTGNANGKALSSIKTSTDKSGYCKCGKSIGTAGHWCCWNYSTNAYKSIWGKAFTRDNNNNLLKSVAAGDRKLTVANLQKYLRFASPGANVRIDTNSSPTAGDSNGHSLIFCGMNSSGDGAYFLEGNYNGTGKSRLQEVKFSSLVSTYKNYTYIKYIMWPGGSSTSLNAPVISNAKITNITGTGATIECDASAANGLQYVQCTVWNVAQGIDKYQWITTPSSVNGNHYTFKFNISAFSNLTGEYKVNIHVWDKREVKTMTSSPLVFTIPTHVHNWVTVNAKMATCTTAGNVEYKKCSSCGATSIANGGYIAPTGHKFVIDPAVKATCTTTGKTEGKHCSVCGVILIEQNTIPATGHSYDEWVNNDDNQDRHIHKCISCGNIEEENHSWNEGEVAEDNSIIYTCIDCNSTKTETLSGTDFEDTSFKQDEIEDDVDDSVTGSEEKTVNKKTSTKVTLKSIKAGKKTIKMSWKPLKNADGYEVQYSTKKKFTNSKIKKIHGNTLKISKLKSWKRYYVRVRMYYYDEQLNIHYGGWSKAKSVLVK